MKSKILGLLAVALLAGPMAAQAMTTFGLEGDFGTDIYSGPLNGGSFAGTYEFNGVSVGAFDISMFDSANNLLAQLSGSNAFATFNPNSSGVAVFQFITIANPINFLAIGFAAVFNGVGSMLPFGGFGSLYGFAGIGGNTVETDSTIISGRSFAVPEPGTLALLGLGLLGLGVTRRRAA